MADKKGSKRPQDGLAAKALEALARRAGHRELNLGPAVETEIPGSGKRLWRFHGYHKQLPNETPHTALLDEEGVEVDLEELDEGDRLAVLRPLPLPVPVPLPLPIPSPVPTAQPVTISPPFNDLVLNPGDTLHETVTVTIPKSSATPMADVYFLADTTGSMGPVLGSVQAGSGSMLTALNSLSIDVAFGVGNYKDFLSGDPYAFQNQQAITKTTAAITSAIAGWSAAGGGDGSEGQLYALDRLAQSPAIGWRPGAVRIVVWFGDAPGHDPICPAATSGALTAAITEASVTADLVTQKITVLAISTVTGYPLGLDDDPTSSAYGYSGTCTNGGSPGQATRITSNTGGT